MAVKGKSELKMYVETAPYTAKNGGKLPNAAGRYIFRVGTETVAKKGDTYSAAKNAVCAYAESKAYNMITLIDGPAPKRFRKKDEEPAPVARVNGQTCYIGRVAG